MIAIDLLVGYCNFVFHQNYSVMLLKTTRDYPEMPDPTEYLPRISLVIPFELKMNKKPELDAILTSAANKVEKELKKNYREEKVMPVIEKLRRLIKDIHDPHNKSIGIFVSPLMERVYYFNYSDSLKNYSQSFN